MQGPSQQYLVPWGQCCRYPPGRSRSRDCSQAAHAGLELDDRLHRAAQDAARIVVELRVHQRRADELITLVRQTAANLLEIPFHAPESSEAFEAKREPFWVTAARTAALNPIPPGAFDRFLPAPMRGTRMRKRLLDEIDAVVIRNVENLRWATRQNLEDSFRRFGAELDERLAMSLAATRGAMQKALEQRKQHAEQIHSEIEAKQTALSRLAEIPALTGSKSSIMYCAIPPSFRI